jgi:CRISPR system Cascade subunit CasB
MNSARQIRTREEQFVEYLTGLVDREDRASLAALRRGLGKAPGEAAEAYRYVVPWLRRDSPPWEDDVYFLVASLFALHQKNWKAVASNRRTTNLGASFARMANEVEGGSVERRFVALLNCDRDDLPEHLRHAISLLKSKEVPVDWTQLLQQIQDWARYDRRVQREWARAFWGALPGSESADSGSTSGDGNPSTRSDDLGEE